MCTVHYSPVDSVYKALPRAVARFLSLPPRSNPCSLMLPVESYLEKRAVPSAVPCFTDGRAPASKALCESHCPRVVWTHIFALCLCRISPLRKAEVFVPCHRPFFVVSGLGTPKYRFQAFGHLGHSSLPTPHVILRSSSHKQSTHRTVGCV
jgi:hypothetical protein